ncbi:MAG: class I tRNA ligase family protein, partial [Phormidesmis sp.]
LEGQSPADLGEPGSHGASSLELADRWILSRYHQTIERVRNQLDTYGMGESSKDLYEFTRGDFCDWYIELVKPRLYGDGDTKRAAQQTLAYVLEGILKLLHPFVPHITEELWHTLTGVGEEDCLALQSYPIANASLIDTELDQQFDLLIDTIRTIRNLRVEAGIKPSAQIEAILKTDSAIELQTLRATKPYIQQAARIETLNIASTDFAPAHAETAETLTVSKAAEIVEEVPAENPAAVALRKFEVSADDSAWQKISAAVLQFLDQPTRYFDNFFADYKKPVLSLSILLGVGMTYKVLNSMLAAIDDVPGLAALFRLVGIGYSVQFGARKVLTQERRDRVIAELKDSWAEIKGDSEDTNEHANRSATQAIQLSPVSEGITAADIIKADSDAKPTYEPTTDQRKMFAGVTGTVQVLIPLVGVVDIEALRAKLEKDLAKAEGEIRSLGGRLSNKGFTEQAPADVVQGARDTLAEAEKQAQLVRERLAML